VRQLARHRAETRRLSVAEAVLAVLDTPAAPDVPRHGTALLVPGYTGTKEDFAPVLDGLADHGHRVVAMDQPGQYESVGPDDPAAYTVTWLGSVVRAVAATFGEPVHLLGHSFGGLVVREAAIADPALFRSVTLLGSGPAALGGPRKDRMAYLGPLLEAGGMQAVYEGVEQLARMDPTWSASPAELREFLRVRFLASSGPGLQGMGDALLNEPDRVDELRATGLPLLVCHGEHDDAWVPATQEAMARRLGSRHEVIAGAAHSPAVEAPEDTLEVLTRFWRDTEDRAAGAAGAPGVRP
jgi:pimeloyl-ACP methyl ester carboxylesterase